MSVTAAAFETIARHGPAVGAGRATVILLHGMARDPADVWAMMRGAMPDDVSVLAPLGAFAAPVGADGAVWFSIAMTEAGPRPDLAQEAASRAGVIAMAEELQGQPLLVAGFSQGGIVALNAMIERPELFAGAVMATGRVIEPVVRQFAPGAAHVGRPFFWSHGRADPIIPIAAQEAGVPVLADYGLAGEIVTHEGGHEVPAEVVARLRAWVEDVLGAD